MRKNILNESKFETKSVPGKQELEQPAHDLTDVQFQELAKAIDLYADIPKAVDIAAGLFMPTKRLALEAAYNAEYRGWYGNRWCPKQSKFGGRGGAHQGADLFVPTGTPLVAVVGPARIQWNPSGSGGKWGNHIFLNFRWRDKKNYTFVYAHLQSLSGSAPRNVSVGETICKSDCTGNAGGSGMFCGTDNPCNGRSDHVHLELFGPSGRVDPITWLGWNVKYADDNRCVSCR